MSLAARPNPADRRAHRVFPLHHWTGFVTPVETRKGVSCRLAVPSQSRGVSANAVPLSDPLVPFPATVSLRIAGDWRADHARDVVDSEPQMTTALLVARGGIHTRREPHPPSNGPPWPATIPSVRSAQTNLAMRSGPRPGSV